MLNKLLLTTAMFAIGASGAFAQGFSGAEIGLEYSDAPDVEDFGGVSYYGSVEFDAVYGIGVALDATGYNFDVGDTDISNVTAHVFYNIDQATAVGLFFGQDNVGDSSNEIFGAEVSYDFGLGEVQGYLGSASDSEDEDVSIYGAAATYELGSGFGFQGAVDAFAGDGFSANATEIGAYYAMPQGPRFGATIGKLSLDADGSDASETFFGIQASVALGPNGGTTFGRRGAFEVVKTGISTSP